jgi:hypothetical protein
VPIGEHAVELAEVGKIQAPAGRLAGYVELYTKVIRAICARKRTVLVLDDAHHADYSSICVLHAVLQPAKNVKDAQLLARKRTLKNKLRVRLSTIRLDPSTTPHGLCLVCAVNSAEDPGIVSDTESTSAILSPSIISELQDIAEEMQSNVMSLEPVDDGAVLLIAQAALASTCRLAKDLRALILSTPLPLPRVLRYRFPIHRVAPFLCK